MLINISMFVFFLSISYYFFISNHYFFYLKLIFFHDNLFLKLLNLRFCPFSRPLLSRNLVQLHPVGLLHFAYPLIDLAVLFLEFFRVSGHVLHALPHSFHLAHKSLSLLQQNLLLFANGGAAIFVKLSRKPTHIRCSSSRVHWEHEFATSPRFQDVTVSFSFFFFGFVMLSANVKCN